MPVRGFARRAGVGLLVGTFLLVALLPVVTKLLFAMPAPSAGFDCDDATLWMYDRLSAAGFPVTPVVGDLAVSGETYEELNHVWLLVDLGWLSLAFDWGTPWLDRQHYEGYPVTRERLLEFVAMDG